MNAVAPSGSQTQAPPRAIAVLVIAFLRIAGFSECQTPRYWFVSLWALIDQLPE